MTIHVTLPDGSPLELPEGATALDAALAIGPRLAKATVAARVNDKLVDTFHVLKDGDSVALITATSPEGTDVMRHTASHIMAQAILRLFPGTKYSIGPTIENGFYYDFLFPQPVVETDLARIEQEMARIVKEDLAVARLLRTGPRSCRSSIPQPRT